MTMDRLSKESQPYWRMERLGADRLSEAELLAIILRSGIRGKTAFELANEVLSSFGFSARRMSNASVRQLTAIKGLGKVKAIQIKAVFELCARLSASKAEAVDAVRNPDDLAGIYMGSMRWLVHEEVVVAMLDSKNKVMRSQTISKGGISGSSAHPREVFAEACKCGCASIAMVHNHPSGDSSPSQGDLDLTRRVAEAGRIIGIELVDHIIIGDGEYASLRNLGVLPLA
ncbi:MAG: DNA repair protein RadC [Oscillospiraceae bacterium]|nr:DNA repair protein RadC [Oscillospiraceae bacterium]